MFHRDRMHAGVMMMTAVSVLITVPFLYYLSSIDRSLKIMAEGEDITDDYYTEDDGEQEGY